MDKKASITNLLRVFSRAHNCINLKRSEKELTVGFGCGERAGINMNIEHVFIIAHMHAC